MPVWEKEKAFFGLVYYIENGTGVSFQVSCIQYSTSPAWLECFCLCGPRYQADSCVMTKMPPEDAGLHSHKVHHPRGIGIFPLISFRVTGQALSRHRPCACALGTFIMILGLLVLSNRLPMKGELWCPPAKDEVRRSLSISLAAVAQSCTVDLGSLCRVVLGIRRPHLNKVQRQQQFDFSGVVLRFLT